MTLQGHSRSCNFISVLVKKNVKKYSPMASRPTRKFISARDREQLMQEIYDQLDGDDSEFLRNQFAGEGGENNTSGSDSDSDSSEEIEKDEISDYLVIKALKLMLCKSKTLRQASRFQNTTNMTKIKAIQPLVCGSAAHL